jgi:poly(beta-D-mannuronate) lyase
MKRLLITCSFFLLCVSLSARNIPVANAEELNKANNAAKPGDTIMLGNGTWTDVIMKLNCSGTEEHPIVFKAQNAGKVIISGISQVRLGGNYIVVDGLLFTNGYSPSNAIIDFRISSDQLANHCRVTNCVINDFNKPKRMSEDYWISFSGKNNRLDHCSFFNKKNLGVLLAVILDSDESRENFHSIDHNYFGVRPPLGSNGGEIIRIGVSEHCQYNSNTHVKDNFFEYCDGETEVVSIKSGSNVVSNNVFKECQGSVVLRHGNNNTVSNNLFLGNGKTATGGVRIINRGQWVINNFFYKCRGESFRSPLAIMNGIPNSPANRYVQVTDAVVLNNTFVDCAPASFGEGSDAERTLPPANVLFARNVFYNNKDSVLYRAWDDLNGIHFIDNETNRLLQANRPGGFDQALLKTEKSDGYMFPISSKKTNTNSVDSLSHLNQERLPQLTAHAGFSDLNRFHQILSNAYHHCGANWYSSKNAVLQPVKVNCKTSADLYSRLKNQTSPLIISLTGSSYSFTDPIIINRETSFTSPQKTAIKISSPENLSSLFRLTGRGSLTLHDISLNAAGLRCKAMIASDTAGSSQHFNFCLNKAFVDNLTSCNAIFVASKSTIADSIIIENCRFSGLNNGFQMVDEKDNKGYYNAEKISINRNEFKNGSGVLLAIYRGGNDESTLGPNLSFSNNLVSNCNTTGSESLVQLTGVQKTRVASNEFRNCNTSKTLIEYKDIVRADHFLSGNILANSGKIEKNEFVKQDDN